MGEDDFTGSIDDATQAYMAPPTPVDPTQQFTGTIGDATNALNTAAGQVQPSLFHQIIGGLAGLSKLNQGNNKIGGNQMQNPPQTPLAQTPVGAAAIHTPQGGGSLLQQIFALGGLQNGQ